MEPSWNPRGTGETLVEPWNPRGTFWAETPKLSAGEKRSNNKHNSFLYPPPHFPFAHVRAQGVQPLHLAAFGGAGHALELLRLLLAHRAAGASADAEKQTALHWAARGGAKTALLEELLKALWVFWV